MVTTVMSDAHPYPAPIIFRIKSPFFASVPVQDQLTGKPYMPLLPVACSPLKQSGPSVWQNTCVLF